MDNGNQCLRYKRGYLLPVVCSKVYCVAAKRTVVHILCPLFAIGTVLV